MNRLPVKLTAVFFYCGGVVRPLYAPSTNFAQVIVTAIGRLRSIGSRGIRPRR